jgi:hypothetical protein
MRLAATGFLALGMVVAGCLETGAQTAPPSPPDGQSQVPASASIAPASTDPAQTSPAQTSAPSAQPVTGGKLHGVALSGKVPLPGVTVTAQNTLTGKRYSTTTNIQGQWSLTIPQNGRYVVRTQFAAFAAGSQEAVLNATSSHDQTVNFDLMLASRALEQQQQQARQGAGSEAGEDNSGTQAMRQLAGTGAQSLSLTSALAAGTETQAGAPSAGSGAGAALPSIAGNSDFSGESVAITGTSGQVNPGAGQITDQMRDAIEQARQSGQFPGGGGLFGGPGGGSFGGGGGFGGGGFGGGGRGNFRGFNPGQPHGSVFWIGTNSALNAEPFSLEGPQPEQPPSGSNRFGITFMSAPYIPHLTKPSGKDTVFFTLSGTRSSNLQDDYANLPTDAERAGDFSAAGLPPIYNPATGLQFTSNDTANVIPSTLITPQAKALLAYYPEPNLPPSATNDYNYQLLTTAQSNSTQAGVRYNRSFGANAAQPGGGGRGGGGGGGRRNTNQGLRQSMNVNYNWTDSAADSVNIFPQLGGKTSSESNSVQAGYTVGYRRITNIFNSNWNRASSQATNYFTNRADIATQDGILGPNGAALNSNPLNYGLPRISLSNLTGLSEQQPSFSQSQTISLSETLSWIHGKHNLRFGGDYRRVHRNFLTGSNATGSFTFSGLFTEDSGGDPNTGSSLADFLLGLPQQSTIDSLLTKAYLRDNVMDAYAQDDWRVTPSLTLNYGLRYEFYAPYTEKYGHLGFVDTNADAAFTAESEVVAGATGPFSGALPASLVFPFHKAFAPRIGVALRLPKQTVLRAGFGMNFTVGQYGSFASTMALQPPFANEQTNEESVGNTASSACARTTPASCFTLADGFPAPDPTGNYSIEPHYPLPYVQAWNIDVQKRLPWGVVMNVGYNGSKGNHLDMRSSPRATPQNKGTDPTNLVFTYDQAEAFSKLSAGTLRLNKQLSKGIALGANYQYSHSIDDAGAVNGVGQVVAQDWQNLDAEEGNSSFDIRHQVNGTYLYELPFGKDKFWFTGGPASHILEGFSVSGSFNFATGGPLTPSYAAAVSSIACGTTGALRPNRTGVSLTAGGGSLNEWFNPAAFSLPTGSPGYCNAFGNAGRNSIAGPGVVSNNMALSKTANFGDTRSLEIRATINNVFNTVQYAGVGTVEDAPRFGEVTSAGPMRNFQFTARFRF